MVGYRNEHWNQRVDHLELIRHSDGGVSEPIPSAPPPRARAYQAFRWWGIGTSSDRSPHHRPSLSGIPMVGYRNRSGAWPSLPIELIRHSDGGVSEPRTQGVGEGAGAYQAFRWWGIGTHQNRSLDTRQSLSGIPMVGYRNTESSEHRSCAELIRHSDGGVSEHNLVYAYHASRAYQAFRWWGIGT